MKIVSLVKKRRYSFPMDYKKHITIVEDFPEKGVRFKDITTLMNNGPVFKQAIEDIVKYAKEKEVDVIVGPEARGFIVGCPVSYELGLGFVPVRKEGKLPREVVRTDYQLEYGKNVLTMHKDAVKRGQKVLITDDLLATGGTIQATIELVEKLGGIVVGCAFLIELSYLEGIDKLAGYDVLSLVTY